MTAELPSPQPPHSSNEHTVSENPPVIIEGRLLNRVPSAEMEELRQQLPHIYNRVHFFTSQLCPNTSINFIGSLLIKQNLDKILATFPNGPELKDQPHALTMNPVVIVDGVEVHEYRKSSNILNFELNQVLVKYGAGQLAGVVLSGPYAGLMLEPMENSTEIGCMAVSRIWNDDANEAVPYGIHIYGGDNSLYDAGYNIYKEARNTFLNNTFQRMNNTEKFILLCQETGIPLDVEAFHFSRPVPTT